MLYRRWRFSVVWRQPQRPTSYISVREKLLRAMCGQNTYIRFPCSLDIWLYTVTPGDTLWCADHVMAQILAAFRAGGPAWVIFLAWAAIMAVLMCHWRQGQGEKQQQRAQLQHRNGHHMKCWIFVRYKIYCALYDLAWCFWHYHSLLWIHSLCFVLTLLTRSQKRVHCSSYEVAIP